MLEIRQRFFLTFISLFSIPLFSYFICLFRFDTNNKRHFLTYVLTLVSNLTNYIRFILLNKKLKLGISL